jgi:hypothetical protein
VFAESGKRSGVSFHACRIQSLGPLLAFELNRFALIQSLVSALLNRREVNKNVLARRALNEAIAFGTIEPLHNTVFFHRIAPFMTTDVRSQQQS